MSLLPSSNPPAQTMRDAFCRQRLQAIGRSISERIAGATVSEVVAGAMGFHSITVALQGGLPLLVSTDADLPEALFEVTRFAGPNDVQRYSFERRTTLGAAYCDKLASDAVLELLRRYQQADALLPGQGPAAAGK